MTSLSDGSGRSGIVSSDGNREWDRVSRYGKRRSPARRIDLMSRILALAALLVLCAAPPVAAAPEGTLTFALHYTLPARWLDPADTESIITPYITLYAIHDALIKPLPGASGPA